MTTIKQKISHLSDQQLIQLSKELQNPIVPEDALVRDLISGTEIETNAPILAFVTVGQLLAFELAERLILAKQELKTFKKGLV